MTERGAFLGLPSHVIVMLGTSTAAYALLLAGVAGLQSLSEADLAAAHRPAVDGVAQLQAGHDGLNARLEAAKANYESTVAAYLAAGGSLDAFDAQLGSLSGLVAEIDGVSRTLPTTVKLPAVRKSVGSVSVPKTSGTTGASGA